MEHNTHRALTEKQNLLLSSLQVILYILVTTSSPPVTSAGIPSDGLHTYVRVWEYRGVPKASSDVARVRGEHYFCTSNLDQIGALKASFHKLWKVVVFWLFLFKLNYFLKHFTNKWCLFCVFILKAKWLKNPLNMIQERSNHNSS